MATKRPNSIAETQTEISDSQITLDGSDRDSDIRNSVGSYDVKMLPNEGASAYYSTDTDEDGISLVPEWKDDGDDSICTNMYGIGDHDIEEGSGSFHLNRIPSTIQFTLGQGNGEDEPHLSPSSINCSQKSSNLLEIEMEDHFTSLPTIAIESGPRLDRSRTRLDLDADRIDEDTTSTIRRNGFRRRLNTSNTEIGSTMTNPFLSTKSQQSSAPSRPFMFRNAPRLLLMIAAILFIMISVHDDIKHSRQYYRQQYQLLSSDINNLRQEIAFPLTQVQDNFDENVMVGGTLYTNQENENIRTTKLPKFYFPKYNHPYTTVIHGSVSAGRPGGNLVMARSHRSRPIFVPDIPLPDGGFQKPSERFVFDPEESDQTEAQARSKQRVLDNDSPSSWTAWLASLTLMGMMFDTGWKGYQRYRVTAISSSRDE